MVLKVQYCLRKEKRDKALKNINEIIPRGRNERKHKFLDCKEQQYRSDYISQELRNTDEALKLNN